MRFYAIAYQLDEDVFYDFNKREDTFEISENCFLPTREFVEWMMGLPQDWTKID